MKNILAIDYGRKKIGVALATSPIAEPIGVYKTEEIYRKVERLIRDHNVSVLVVGESEGEMALEAREFGERLASLLGVSVQFIDETLSSQDAHQRTLEAGIQRKRRRNMEDAFAAALILQRYLDSL